ncbi:MAG: transcription termination factor Rho [Gemmatimonadaceae bacterium]|nr:transcription termination factor Rho [Gemmatimonadaceae bacterium]
MTERRRTPRTRKSASDQTAAPESAAVTEVNPYRESAEVAAPPVVETAGVDGAAKPRRAATRGRPRRVKGEEAPTDAAPMVTAAESPRIVESAPPPPPPPMAAPELVRPAEFAADGARDGGEPRTDGTAEPREWRGGRRGRFRDRRDFRQGQGGDRPQGGGGQAQGGWQPRGGPPQQGGQQGERDGFRRGRRGRNRRGRERTPDGAAPIAGPSQQQGFAERPAPTPITAEGEVAGWFDLGRDGNGFIRRAHNSYLADPQDPFVPQWMWRPMGLRRGDRIEAAWGRDHRNRIVCCEIKAINGLEPAAAAKRPDFGALMAEYPDRPLTLETGRPAKTGPELTRRAIDLIAPIGFGQRALIVAPARAGKTTLLQAIVQGVVLNHPTAELLILLVDERPEEVSEMVSWGCGEVVASSFDMPAQRHRDVTEIVLERARRMVELGKDVVIVLDSITRMARAFNNTERGGGRTMSGGLDSTAMARPKAFFGSARAVSKEHGGGSLTIIATALVETGSRMDDIIFEEFKGTGNCEIKLDRSLADKRIFPAFDISTSGTRREEKLYKPELLEKVWMLRRGLQQMPPSSAMEWLIKRIANTPNNDDLLRGL